MYDALTIAALVDEVGTDLVNGRVQQIVQPDALTIALEVYALRQRRWLVISAHPDHARIQLTTRRIDGDTDRVSPLLLLLRKYARGGRIVAVSQPRYERIVLVSIAKPLEPDNRDEDEPNLESEPELTYVELHAELMGRRSNIMLVNSDGRILDAIKRVSPEMSRVRPIRPGAQYVAPPPQQKGDPRAATAASLLAAAHGSTMPLDRWLVAQYVAVSPVLAREIVVRAGLDPDLQAGSLSPADTAAMLAAITSVFAPLETGAWRPVVYVDESGRAEFSPIRLTSFEHQSTIIVHEHDTISSAAEAAWEQNQSVGEVSTSPQRHAARRERLLQEIYDARSRIDHRIHSLREQQQRATAAEQLRTMGEAIYAAFSEIQPHQTELQTESGLVIALDATLTASENAQAYFERYRKARSANEHLPSMIEQAQTEQAYLNQLRSMIVLSETYDEIESARIEWLAYADQTPGALRASRPKGAQPAASARRPRSFRTRSGATIHVGRTGQQNDAVTFDLANPDDLWLHVRNMPGAHVILRDSGGRDEQNVEAAAALAAWYSDGRHSTSVPVDVTERRYVRKIRGAGPGMVTYRNERTLNVRPQSEVELGLEQSTR